MGALPPQPDCCCTGVFLHCRRRLKFAPSTLLLQPRDAVMCLPTLNAAPAVLMLCLLCRAYLKGFLLQLAVITNHQNGRDTHIRQVGRARGWVLHPGRSQQQQGRGGGVAWVAAAPTQASSSKASAGAAAGAGRGRARGCLLLVRHRCCRVTPHFPLPPSAACWPPALCRCVCLGLAPTPSRLWATRSPSPAPSLACTLRHANTLLCSWSHPGSPWPAPTLACPRRHAA